jgi:hypothetical protein
MEITNDSYMSKKITKHEFQITSNSMGKQVPFTYSNHTTLLDIPNVTSINEHAYRLIDQWNLPVFLFPST